jgi:hypothetical protein
MIGFFGKKTSNIPVDNGSSLNRIQAIRVLEVRVTVFFTNKKHVLIDSKPSNFFEYRIEHYYQSQLIQP